MQEMAKFDFSEALPIGKRSFYLKGQAISTLQTSLIHIFDTLGSLLTADVKKKCDVISNPVHTLQEKASIFPYVLLNARLSDALQQQKKCLKAGTFFSPEFLDLKIQDYQAKFQKRYNTVLEVAKLTDLGKAILINSCPICFGKN
jgi:hypothetical protein